MQVINMVANVMTNAVAGTGGNAAQAPEAEQGEAGSFLQALAGLNLPPASPQTATKLQLPIPGAKSKESGDGDAANEEIDPALMLLLQAQPQPQPQAQNQAPAQEDAEPLMVAAPVEGASQSPPVLGAQPQPVDVSQAPIPFAADKAAAPQQQALPQTDLPVADAKAPEVQAVQPKITEVQLPASQKAASEPKMDLQVPADGTAQTILPPTAAQSASPKKPAAKSDSFSSLLSKFDFSGPKESAAQVQPPAAPALKPAPAENPSQDKGDKNLDLSFTLAANAKPEVEAKATAPTASSETVPANGVSSDASTPAPALNAPVTHQSTSDMKPAQDISAQPHLRSHVGTTAWREELGTQMNWMVEKGQHSASIKLTPEHLGPVEVRIDVNQDQQASVWFSAQHSETRAALEQALPQLREMLAAQGMQLNDAGVHREPPKQQAPNEGANSFSTNTLVDTGEEMAPQVATSRLGLLDTYA